MFVKEKIGYIHSAQRKFVLPRSRRENKKFGVKGW